MTRYIAVLLLLLTIPAKGSSLLDVETYVNNLLKETDGNKILLILDVDGTLTDRSEPGKHPVKPRGNAVKFVENAVAKDVNVVASSAWNAFGETLGRIKALGLESTLGSEGKMNCGFEQVSVNEELTQRYFFCAKGRVASVRFNNKYFRHKALSYLFAEPKIDADKITHVVFADDSEVNIQMFRYDVAAHKKALYGREGLSVKIFQLSAANGEENLK